MRTSTLALVLLLAARPLLAQTPHPCDQAQPATFTPASGAVTVSVCWSGLTTDTPPKPVTGTWTLIDGSTRTPIAMTPGTSASSRGQFEYTGSATLAPGIHTLNLEVATPTGGTAQQLAPVTVTVAAIPPSPSGTRIPPALSLIDAGGIRWSLVADVILRDGIQPANALGKQILSLNGQIYIQGDDVVPTWYQWTGGTWKLIGADPAPVTQPANPCLVTPLKFSVSSWPSGSGTSYAVFARSGAVTVTFNLLASPISATAVDARGCSVTVTKK